MKNKIIESLKRRRELYIKSEYVSEIENIQRTGVRIGLDIAIEEVEKSLKDDPEKPVIPKFVAEWIEETRTRNLNLRGFLNNAPQNVDKWLYRLSERNERLNTVARAWIDDDYEVEEPKYYARHNWLKNRNGDNYLNEHILNLNYILENNDETKNFKTKFTKSELEQLSIWDNSDWEIEEVDQEG